jgi:hypothetical protein
VEGNAVHADDIPISEKVVKAAQSGSAAVLYLIAWVVLYKFTNKYTILVLVVFGAVSGQFIFV